MTKVWTGVLNQTESKHTIKINCYFSLFSQRGKEMLGREKTDDISPQRIASKFSV